MFLNFVYLVSVDISVLDWATRAVPMHWTFIFYKVKEWTVMQQWATGLPLILPKFLSDSSQSVASEYGPCTRAISRACPWSPCHTPQSVQAQGEAVEEQSWALVFTSVLAAGDISLWERAGQRKEVQLFIWYCLLGSRGVWRVFSYCTGQGSMSWAQPLPGPPQKCSRVAMLAGGVLFLSLFIFLSFSP